MKKNILLSLLLISVSLNVSGGWKKGIYRGGMMAVPVVRANAFAGIQTYGTLSNPGLPWAPLGLNEFYMSCVATDGTIVLVGTLGGLFLSSNNGSSWTHIGLSDKIIECLAINGTRIFAGTQDGLFLSTNNGASWSTVNGAPTNWIHSIAISGTTIFVGTPNGIFISHDNGSSWNASNNGLTDLSISVVVLSGTNVLAGTSSGLFLSSDYGLSWGPVNNGLTSTHILSLAVCGNNIFAGTLNGVFRSTNTGASWTYSNNNEHVFSFAVNGTDIYAGTGLGIFISSDNGSSWTSLNDGLTNTSVLSLATGGASIFAVMNGGGVWRNDLLITDLNTINKLENKFLIFPNPNNGTFVLQFMNEDSRNYDVSIYNLLGEIVYTSQQADYGFCPLCFKVNLKEQRGVYNVHVRTEDGISCVKRVVIE